VYVYADASRFVGRSRAGFAVLWAPSLLLRVGRGSGSELMISDCSLTTFFSRQSLIRVLSSLVLPSGAVRLVSEAPVEALELEPSDCSAEGLESSARAFLELFGRLAESEVRLPGVARQALSHILSPTRLVLGDIRVLGEGVGSRIVSSMAADIVSRVAEFLRSGDASIARVLYVIDTKKPEAFAVLGDRLVKNPVISSELSRDREAMHRVLALFRS